MRFQSPPRRLIAPAALSLLAAVSAASLLSCASGDPIDVSAAPSGEDWYVFATATLLDTRDPCLPTTCPPEFFTCDTREPILALDEAGQPTRFEFFGDTVVNGALVGAESRTSSLSFGIAATDIANGYGLALELQLREQTATAISTNTTTGGDVNNRFFPDMAGPQTFFNVDVTCDQRNDQGALETRFDYLDFAPSSVEITEFATVDEGGTEYIEFASGRSGNSFATPGVIAGTFSFRATNRQLTIDGPEQATVLVEGCFRLPLPTTQQELSTTTSPGSPICLP